MKFNPVLDDISIYEAGKPIELVVREYGIKPQDVIKLASNENPNGCSLKVTQTIIEKASSASLYPDDSMYQLKDGLAKRFNIKQDQLIIGAGSDQVIEFAVHTKLGRGKKVLMNNITFAMYEIYAKHVGADIIKTDSIQHDLDQFYSLYQEHKPDMIFLCVPNNPTGDALNRDDVYEFIEKIDKDTLVVVDGAYMEYAQFKDKNKKIEPLDLINRFENVLYLGTFSKAYGLGGMRVGYGIAQSHIIQQLYKIRPPFNIGVLSLAAAISALEDNDFVQSSVSQSFKEMKKYEQFIKELGLDFIDSYTNFITILLKDKSSKEITQTLLEKGLIVRDLTGYGLNAIRVTIGTKKQNKKFFKLFKKVV